MKERRERSGQLKYDSTHVGWVTAMIFALAGRRIEIWCTAGCLRFSGSIRARRRCALQFAPADLVALEIAARLGWS
jgi:hypothetical protein